MVQIKFCKVSPYRTEKDVERFLGISREKLDRHLRMTKKGSTGPNMTFTFEMTFENNDDQYN